MSNPDGRTVPLIAQWRSASWREYFIQVLVSFGTILLFHTLASSLPCAGKSVYLCLVLLNIFHLGNYRRLQAAMATLTEQTRAQQERLDAAGTAR